jgi:hypothetical protein
MTAHKRLVNMLNGTSWKSEEVARCLQILQEKSLVSSWHNARVSLGVTAEHQLITDLSEMLGLLRGKQADMAMARGLASVPNPLTDERLENSEVFSDGSSRALLSELRDSVIEYSRMRKQLSSNEKEVVKKKEEFRRIIEKHLLVANDLAEFFSLAPENELASEDVKLYSGGYLEDLPRLKGLRDGIEDLVSLRTEIARAGGSVRVGGDNPHAMFIAKLGSLHQSSTQLVKEAADAKLEIQRLIRAVDEIGESLTKNLGGIERKLVALLAASTAPR